MKYRIVLKLYWIIIKLHYIIVKFLCRSLGIFVLILDFTKSSLKSINRSFLDRCHKRQKPQAPKTTCANAASAIP